MLKSALEKKVKVLGFSEHSPRPKDFSYGEKYDYQEKLVKKFPDYQKEVLSLQEKYNESNEIQVLFGIEQDFFPGYEKWISDFFSSYNFDYKIGSVHFLGNWGFDVSLDIAKWEAFSAQEKHKKYEEYFSLVNKMIDSGLFDVAAHLDLIKIFTADEFNKWKKGSEAKAIFENTLQKTKEKGMSLEISSAGLRKPCREIYPCKEILEIASEMKIPISFASDAHVALDVACDFDLLHEYASNFGYKEQAYFKKGEMILEGI